MFTTFLTSITPANADGVIQRTLAELDINAANKTQRIEEWRAKVGLDNPAELTDEQKTEAASNVFYLPGYGKTCQQLEHTIMNPEQLLGLRDKTTHTLVGLPENCVEQAISVARKFDLHIDFNEAKHLAERIGKVRAYYEARPEIPKPGKDIKLPEPV